MARSSRGEDARFSFWKQGFDSPTGYDYYYQNLKKAANDVFGAFFVLQIVQNVHKIPNQRCVIRCVTFFGKFRTHH
jgi:hypothetical protein